ncbi:MAG: hypothetical protein FWE36_05830 [Erysipelotrichales bacterium]|nr:hypothetical protein [Erysipelotrichales bacterium]
MKKILFALFLLIIINLFYPKSLAADYPEAVVINTESYKLFQDYTPSIDYAENGLYYLPFDLSFYTNYDPQTILFIPTEKNGTTNRLHSIIVRDYYNSYGDYADYVLIEDIGENELYQLNYREDMKRYFNGVSYGIRFSASDFDINYQFSLVELIFVIKSDKYSDSLTSILNNYKPIYLEFNPIAIELQIPAIIKFGHRDIITNQDIIKETKVNNAIEIDYYKINGEVEFLNSPLPIGTYNIAITAYDTSRKSEIVNFQLEIVKQINYSPGGMVFSNIDNLLSIDFIKSFITATDKEDGDLTNNIKIFSNPDNYPEKVTKLANYELIFSVTDSRNNETRIKIIVRVVDITPPIIKGSNKHTIFKNDGTALTTDFIKNSLNAIDNYDGNISHKIEVLEDEYQNQYQKTGIYNIVFQVTDSSTNESKFHVTVTVIDDEYPELNFRGLIIPINQGNNLTQEEIIALINKHLELKQVFAKDLMIIENNYSGNENYPGTYLVKVSYTNIINQPQLKDINFLVLETKQKNFFVENKEILITIASLTGIGLVGIIIRRKFSK